MNCKYPQYRRMMGPLSLVIFFALLGCLAARGLHMVTAAGAAAVERAPAPARSYTTRFERTEKPIAEGGNWVNGKAVGLDWADVCTVRGLAYGIESGNTGYDDSTALLTGRWGADQMARATVHSVNQNDKIYEEVELRLRSSLSAHRATGYEINFRCSKTANAYNQIVRWNGPLNDFTYLSNHGGARYGVADGDVIKATIVGNRITVYINDVKVNEATDDTFATGSPGMGFFLQGTTGVNADYGFTSFTATDKF